MAAKGIRVNFLAKELGVDSKAILQKLREEGLGDAAPNHMSTLSLGLAESVREWFSDVARDGGGTAVETAAHVEVAPKANSWAKKKKEEPAAPPSEETPEQDKVAPPAPEQAPATPEPEPVVPEPEAKEVKPAEPVAPEKKEEPPQPAPVVVAPPAVVVEPLPPPQAPAAPAPVPPPVQPELTKIAATVAPPAPVAPPAKKPVKPPTPPSAPAPAVPPTPPPAAPMSDRDHGRVTRPTVTLANRGQKPEYKPPQKPIVQAPQLTTLQPAKIQGPRVVRIEREEPMATRQPRVPRPAASADTGITPVQPRGGRGVRSADDEEEDAKKAAKKGNSLSSRRRGIDGRRGEAMEKLKEFTEADQIARRDALNAATNSRSAFDSRLRQIKKRGTHAQAKSIVQKGEPVTILEPITVRSLAGALGIKTSDVMGKLMKDGVFATVNQSLEKETAETMAMEFGIELKIVQQETLEEILFQELSERPAVEENLRPRPPVVTILGHVDHGKTSLLDKIRDAHVAAGEAGGITQHTAAWMVQLGEKRVTFIDTPGHQAFTSMRARGANMTDVVVLVVGAIEGVQPQTIESINHARAANVPIVVAMNKIDRPDANPEMVLGQLAKEGLNPVEYGGETEVIRTSALTGQGVPELIEILDLQSQLMDLKADPTAPARGTVIESRVDEGLGPVATVLVQNGTLRPGDTLLAGIAFGRIRNLVNDRGETILEAGPSTPVVVSGLDQLPLAGDKFYALDDLDRARAIAEERQSLARRAELAGVNKVTLDNLMDTMKADDIKTINLIIKGDVQGSVETLTKTVTEANTQEVRVRVIHSAVGPVNESDVELADASGAVIIGFHVSTEEAARAMAEQRHVEVRLYRVIYEIFDDLKKALSGLLEPEIREKYHGRAEIRKVYKVSKVGNVAGCFVIDGHIQRGSKIRLIRDGVVITQDLSMESLKRMKDDVKEVKSGFECGIKLAGYDDIKVGDVMEGYVRETFQRTL